MKISAYSTVRNADEMEYPYIESIKSHLQFADEVIVFDTSDGRDKTLDTLFQLEKLEHKLKIIHSDEIDWNAPNHGVYDGYCKTLARKSCSGDILWQFDIDEIVHENHIKLIRPLAESIFNTPGVDLIALPVIDYWGRNSKVRIDVTVWKWRMSKNNKDIIHGIPIQLRKYEDGLLYAMHGTDGCDYIFESTGNIVPCAGYLPNEFHAFKQAAIKNENHIPDLQKYLDSVNSQLPGVHHYSWFNIERKIRNFKLFWHKSWKSLYNENREEKNNPFFPGLNWSDVSDSMIKNYALKLENETGGHVFHLPWDGLKNNWIYTSMNHPAIMKDWLESNK